MQPWPDVRTILIADDDGDVLDALKFALELEGYKVGAFRSGAALLAAASAGNAACLVIDQNLPETNGLELIVRLRAAGMSAPAVLITTHLPPGLRAHASVLGVPVVEKPLLTDALFAAIRSMTGGPAGPGRTARGEG